MSDIFNISQCNISQIIGEANRFLFHILLVHIASNIIEKKNNLFGDELFRTLIITALAIVLYHILFRKIVEPKIEKMKLICLDGHEKHKKKKELDKNDIFKSNIRTKTHSIKDAIQNKTKNRRDKDRNRINPT